MIISILNIAIDSSHFVLQRSRSRITFDDGHIFETPKKLISSPQVHKSGNSEVSMKQGRIFRSPCTGDFEPIPAPLYSQNGFSRHPASNYDHIFLPNMKHDANKSKDGQEVNSSSESVSSSEYVPISADEKEFKTMVPTTKLDSLKIYAPKERYMRSLLSMVCGLFVLVFTASVCLLWIGGDQDEGYNLLPT